MKRRFGAWRRDMWGVWSDEHVRVVSVWRGGRVGWWG